MNHTTSGRIAFILAAAIMTAAGGPARAAEPQTDAPALASPAEAQAVPATPSAGADPSAGPARQDDVRAPVFVTQTETPAPRATPIIAGSHSATWDETTLIGKIFIGFGALLTLASAARMFMA